MKQDELFDHLMPARCSAHKGVIAFRRHGSAGQNGAALLLSNTLLAYLFYCSYLLGDKSCRGEAADHKKARPGAGGWAERHAHFFLFIAVCRMFLRLCQLLAHEQENHYANIIKNAVSTTSIQIMSFCVQ